MADISAASGKFVAIVYATESLLPRRLIQSDTADEMKMASVVAAGESVLDATDAVVDHPMPWPPETIRQIIADHVGAKAEDIPSGRCAVVDPKTQLVGEQFIVADPALDAHPDGHTLVSSDDAQPNWKLDEKTGDLLARFVGGGADGKVTDVTWALPDAPPAADPGLGAAVYVQDSFAEVGDEHPQLKTTEVETSGATAI